MRKSLLDMETGFFFWETFDVFLKFSVFTWLHILKQWVFHHCVKASIFTSIYIYTVYVNLGTVTISDMEQRLMFFFITAKNIIVKLSVSWS